MARMIPVDGPLDAADVSAGERSVFALLKRQLPEEFLVIHSLPWLTLAVREVDVRFAPTGEIDFVVLHPELGVLALEVKSGRYTVHGTLFTRVRCGTSQDVLKQTRHNVHGLARWLGSAGLRQRIGYGFIFPHSSFSSQALPPGLEDSATAERLVVDYDDLSRVGERVIELMRYWKQALSAPSPGRDRIARLEQMLCPAFDGTPMWGARAASDAKFFLRLTAEQATVIERVCRGDRTVVTGWPGTGKTLIAVEMARRLVALGKSVLVVTFNTRLAEHLRVQLDDLGSACQATHWHKLCAVARQALARSGEGDAWLKQECLVDLTDALNASAVARFDAVVVDEAQALRPEWIAVLAQRVSRGIVAVFCDETQRFSFEMQGATLDDVLKICEVDHPFVLTHIARMPRTVTDRLLGVSDLGYQVTSPRVFEEDTLRELVLEASQATVEECVSDMIAKGFKHHEIAVLTSSMAQESVAMAIAHPEVDVESVARFRGLEAPAVIIVNAHDLTDAELFCAYSRATTLCVAIYDAEALAWKAPGLFRQPMVTKPDVRSVIEEARKASVASDLVRRHSKATMLALDTVVLGWSGHWGGWVLEFDTEDDIRSMWIEYLCDQHGTAVYHWWKDTRRDFSMTRPSLTPGQRLERIGNLAVAFCPKCTAVLPCSTDRRICQSCSGDMKRDVSPPSLELLQVLRDADTVVSAARNAPPHWRAKPDLPLPLYALAVAEFARAHPRHAALGLPSITTGTLLYRTASACLQAKLVHSRAGSSIQANELADRICSRVTAVSIVGQAKWRAAMANAFAVLYQKKILERVGRGAYRLPA